MTASKQSDLKQAGARCPICRKPTLPDYRPFCSRRCADVDLGRWFNESYVVEGETAQPLAGAGGNDEDAD